MKTIDVTPTWAAILPDLIELARNGTNQEAMRTAEAELRRMAAAADRWNAHCKFMNEQAQAQLDFP